jgi:PAS domain-containing protein
VLIPPPTIAPADEFLPALLDLSLSGVVCYSPIFDAGGQILDLAFTFVNPAAQRMLDISARPEQTYLQQFPHSLVNGGFAFHCEAYETSEPLQFELSYDTEGYDTFCQVAARRLGQSLLVSFTFTGEQEQSAAERVLRQSKAREQAAREQAETQRSEIQHVFEQAPVAICILRGPEFVVELANPALEAIWGRSAVGVVGQPFFTAMPATAGQGLEQLLTDVLVTGEPYFLNEVLITLDREHAGLPAQGYFSFTYQPLRDAQGQTTGIITVGSEVTEQVRARQLVEQLNQELEARVAERTRQVQAARAEADHQRQRLERLFMEAPASICMLSGPDFVFELVNPGYKQLLPGRELLGRPFVEAVPELANHSAVEVFRQIYRTGQTHQELGILVPVVRPDGVLEERYFNYVQQARRDEHGQVDGILVFAFEVTEQVRAR